LELGNPMVEVVVGLGEHIDRIQLMSKLDRILK
jgi:hypothetical protein